MPEDEAPHTHDDNCRAGSLAVGGVALVILGEMTMAAVDGNVEAFTSRMEGLAALMERWLTIVENPSEVHEATH